VLVKDLIKNTLGNRFDPDNFILFAKNLFNEIEIAPQDINVPANSTGHISKFTLLGEYTDSKDKNIDVLTVELIGDTKVERARALQRNLIAKFLKDSAGDSALVAFYSQNNPDWRLSFVKLDYQLGSKGAKVEVGTPPKRYSFLVGETEPSHTAQTQLWPILKEQQANPLVSEIEEAFSIEKVTKEFYQKYRSLYDKLSDALLNDKKFQLFAEKANLDTPNFAKKVLGQIVFLYFLQKKGWLGVHKDKKWGEGDKRFLRSLFDDCISKNMNFYNDYLEHLFYDALNNPNREGADPSYYDRFACRIPFLNGGLFEEDYEWRDHKGSIVKIDNKIFSEDHEKGNGILDVFDRYNFTVKEDEPLEKEVAVDPEMLGKVFENLLPENLRKGQGAYYTPREIVHYMCQESLINYLATETKVDQEKIRKLVTYKNSEPIKLGDTADEVLTLWDKEAELLDKALASIKVCDPACGSGAFLVGMLHEIVNARILLTDSLDLKPEDKKLRTEYVLKNETIQNSIYGVDIDLGAVEIAKLRLWLSLVVDYELDEIKPLPNLYYKIMCGNSLLEELVVGDDSIKLFDEDMIPNPKKQSKQTGLFDHEFDNIDPQSTRKEYLQQLRKQKQDKIYELHSSNKLTSQLRKQLDKEIISINKELNPKIAQSKVPLAHATLFEEEKSRHFETLRTLHKRYFNTYDLVKKKTIRDQIDNIELNFIKSSIKEKVKAIDARMKNLNLQISEDRKKHALLQSKSLEYISIPNKIHRTKVRPYFLWKLNFFEVFQEKGGFDVMIANPPYIKEYVNRNAFNGLRNSPYYQGKMDIWYLFACKGTDLLKKNKGTLIFIAQNNWVTSSGASRMRNKVIADTQILQLIDFGNFKIFENAGIQTMIMMFEFDRTNSSYVFDFRRLRSEKIDFSDALDLLTRNKNARAEYLRPAIQRSIFVNKSLTFSNSSIEELLSKIYAQHDLKLDGKKEVAQGIVCPQDHVNKVSQKTLGGGHKINDGIFILSDEEKRILSFSNKELDLIKPIYTTRELFRYYGNPKNREWIIYTDSRFNKTNNIQPYPNIKEHLDKFRKVITSDNKPYGLHRARNEYFFKGEKIISVRKCATPTFTYTDFDCYVTATFYVIKSELTNLKYVTALLNSKLIAFWLKHKGKMQGNNYQIDKEPILDIPIKKGCLMDQRFLAGIIDKILTIMKEKGYQQNDIKQAKVKAYERQIDQNIYKLYDFTSKEIEIVENFK